MFQFFKKNASRGSQKLMIGLVGATAETRKKYGELASASDGVTVQLLDASMLRSGAQPAGINVYVYDLDTQSETEISAFDQFMRLRNVTIPVVVLSAVVSEELVRWFLQLRVSDWLKAPVAAGELLAACGRALSQSSSSRKDGKCIAFIGAKGGVGTTTIAIHAAYALAKTAKVPTPVCMVDLDFANSSCADYLDLEPAWQVQDLASDPGRLDTHMFDSMIVKHKSGITVLSAPHKALDEDSFSEEVIAKPLDMALQKYGTLVVDLPRSSSRWLDNVIGGATQTFVVTEFTVPGLKAARRLVSTLATEFPGETPPKVIVNKYKRSFFGSNLSSTEAKELLGDRLSGFVGFDAELLDESVNRGTLTTEIKSKNRFYLDIVKIIKGAA